MRKLAAFEFSFSDKKYRRNKLVGCTFVLVKEGLACASSG
jgi:hypothetical protein